ncbi:hypothetical protein MferCBS31731_002479 [Microsporum ferrugineum]
MTWKEFHRVNNSPVPNHYTPSPGVISSKYNHLLKAGFTLPEINIQKPVFPPRDYTPTPSGNSIYSDDDAATHISFEANSPSGQRLDYFERHSASESKLRNQAALPMKSYHRPGPVDTDSDFSDTGPRNGRNRPLRKPRSGGFVTINGGSETSNAEKLKIEKQLKDVEVVAREIKAAWEEVRLAIRDVMFVEQWDRGGMGPKTSALESTIDRLIEKSATSEPATSTNT